MSEDSKGTDAGLPDPTKFDSAAAYAVELARLRATVMGSISERIRTLCLGALVVVWGIFSGEKGKSNLNVTKVPRAALLIVALAVVLVLALDIVEYLARFQAVRRLAGEFTSRLDYRELETRMRWAKVVLGLAALAVLCATLAYLLLTPSTTAHAQTNPASPYLGTWCGGVTDQGTYSCLTVQGLAPMEYTGDGPRIRVRYTYQAHAWMNCSGVQISQNSLTAQCGKGLITASRSKYGYIDFQIQVGQNRVGTRLTKAN